MKNGIINQLFKMKLLTWILIIIILFGLLIIIHNYFASQESFNTKAPIKYLNLNTTSPIKAVAIYGGADYLNLNSILFFDQSGNQLKYGVDYSHTASNPPERWGDQNISVLQNSNENQIDSFYIIDKKNLQFTTVFNKPVNLGQIYIRNRINPNSRPAVYSPNPQTENTVRKRISTYKLQLYYENSPTVASTAKLTYPAAMDDSHTLNDQELQTGPKYDISFLIRLSPDIAATYAAKKAESDRAIQAAKDEASRKEADRKAKEAEQFRQNSINDILTQAKSIDVDAQSLKSQFDSQLNDLKTNAANSEYISTKIDIDSESSQLYLNDAVAQISSNNVTTDKINTKQIFNNMKDQYKTAIVNLGAAIDVYNKIITSKYALAKTPDKINALEVKLQNLNASAEQMNTYNESRSNIKSYIDDANEKIKQAPTYVNKIEDMASNIVNSSKFAESNFNTAAYAEKIKINIENVNAINTLDNEYYIGTMKNTQVEQVAGVPFGLNAAAYIST